MLDLSSEVQLLPARAFLGWCYGSGLQLKTEQKFCFQLQILRGLTPPHSFWVAYERGFAVENRTEILFSTANPGGSTPPRPQPGWLR